MGNSTDLKTGNSGFLARLRFVMKCVDKVNWAIARVVSFLVLALMFLVSYEVAARYLFNRPTNWSMELNQYIFITIISLGGAYVLSIGGHVSVDILYARFSLRKKAILSSFTTLVMIAFLAIVLWRVWGTAILTWQWNEHSTSSWNPPVYPMRFIIAIGVFLFLVQAIVRLIKFIIQIKTGEIEVIENAPLMEETSK